MSLLFAILFWCGIAAGVIGLLYAIALIVVVNELVRIAMEDGETGWHD